MIDIKLIRDEEGRNKVKENIKKKYQEEKLPLVDEIYTLDVEYLKVKQEMDIKRGENKWL